VPEKENWRRNDAMTDWVRWTVPATALISISTSAYAVQYMSVADAQRAAFSGARLTEVEAGRVWKTGTGGVFVLDRVIGKHLYIDYAVSIEGGRVRRVDILAYRESYGGEVRSPSWLSQFVGKTSASPLKVGSDIRNISGATLSSMHITEGVKRILAAYGHTR
jgi:uncharacterized protein with FMN-binding domain